jgi:hypothetical protein
MYQPQVLATDWLAALVNIATVWLAALVNLAADWLASKSLRVADILSRINILYGALCFLRFSRFCIGIYGF